MDLSLLGAFSQPLLGIVLTALVTSLLGSYIVVRRMSFIAGGITHSSFGGLGLGFYLGKSPVLFAMVAAVLSGLAVDYLSRDRAIRQDSAIAAIWSFGMALGVLFTFLTPGYTPGLSAFLFGNILLVSRLDLCLLGGYLAVTLFFVFRWYRILLFVAYDEEYGLTRGLPIALIRTLSMVWICVGIVLSIRALGIMMLMSMLTLPQMTVNLFTSDFRQILVWSSVLSLSAGLVAFLGSFYLNLPTGACSILLLSALFLLSKVTRSCLSYASAGAS